MDGDRLAGVFQEFEENVHELLAHTITHYELVALVTMIVKNEEGAVANVPRRRLPPTGLGLWEQHPASSFLEIPDSLPNRLRGLRLLTGRTLEDLASEVDEPSETVALWECGVAIPDAQVERLAGMFGVTPEHLTGEGA
jgi:hypothetical protein